MTPVSRPLTCLRVLAIIAIGQTFQAALAQQCYYPNGKEAPEKPCSSASGSHCCPDKWECLDNGLCHYPPDKIFGTYSCTDKSWKAPGCPSNLCTMKLTRVGGESMTQCSNKNNQWCCNADNIHVKCCEESPSPRPFFNLKSGSAYATIGGRLANQAPILNTIVGEATSGDASFTPTATPTPSSGASREDSSPATTGPSTPITSVQTSLSSGTAGIVTVVQTTVITPPAASQTAGSPPPSSTSNSSSSKIPVIVGCAVGIPLSLALLAILIWLFRKRSQQKKSHLSDPTSSLASPNPYAGSTINGSGDVPSFTGGAKMTGATKYKAETGVPELSGQSVGPGRPISTIKGRAELESGAGFAPGAAAPHAPHLVGVGGGTGQTPPVSSWGSAPPGYSPGQNHESWASQPPGVVEADGTPVANSTGTEQTTEGGRYIPYRPPQSAQAQGNGLNNLPEMAEMSAVKTPPELSADRTLP